MESFHIESLWCYCCGLGSYKFCCEVGYMIFKNIFLFLLGVNSEAENDGKRIFIILVQSFMPFFCVSVDHETEFIFEEDI